MSMDACLGVIVPVDRVEAALEAIRELSARVSQTDGEDVVFSIQVEKSPDKSDYFSTRSKFWQADVTVERGDEFAEITFYCPTNDDGMELAVDKSPILRRIAQTLKSTGLIGGYFSSDGERMLLTKRLTPSKADVDWDEISYGAEGVDDLAAVCSQSKK